jgi:hypothetical protein
MFDRMRTLGTRVIGRTRAAIPPARDADVAAGEYELLYRYLRDRYASRVVLTFAEIEDLVGFPLPEDARVQPRWWDVTAQAARRSAQSVAWTLAGRTATVNLLARSVLFERETA